MDTARSTARASGPVVPDISLGWALVGIVAALQGIIGWLDWGLLWVPLKFGNAEWEFGTIAGAFQGLPLATFATAALAATAVSRGWTRTTAAVGAFGILMALVLLGLLGVFGLDIPLAIKNTDPAVGSAVKKVILKTGLLGLLSVATYGTIGICCLRALRNRSGGRVAS